MSGTDIAAIVPRFDIEIEECGDRDLLALLEMVARATVCLILPDSTSDMKLQPLKGYGWYVHALRNLGVLSPEVSSIADVQVSARGQIISGQRVEYWRNFASHGGLIPSGFDSIELRRTAREVVDSFNVFFQDWTIVSATDEDGACAAVRGDTGNARANPIVAAVNGSWGFWHQSFGAQSSRRVAYFMVDADTAELVIEQADDEFWDSYDRYVTADREDLSGNYRSFRKKILEDIESFRDPDFPIEFDSLEGTMPFAVRWRLQKSDGSDDRIDVFDIEAGDNTRRWARGGDEDLHRLTYKDFIKDVCSWNVLVGRILRRAERLTDAESEWSASTFGGVREDFGIERRVKTEDATGSGFGIESVPAIGTSIGLVATLDRYVKIDSGQPQIFFLAGEAGIGKTYTLRLLSRDRAAKLSEDRGSGPIYLYVDCSGIQLRNLEDAISAAVSEMLVLTSDRVFALCRNGLMVLLIDGFDELLGGAGYRDALQVLDGVLQKLGTSGTMVLSARSSYLGNQYRRSLADQVSGGASYTPVTHQMLTLEKWSQDEVDSLFETREGWDEHKGRLDVSERKLLGLPFFARMFDSLVATNQLGEADSLDLVQLLLDAYLDRELNKLKRGRIEGLSREELRSVLIECCVMMFESGASDLEEDDFILCAGAALGRDFGPGATERDRNLANRLSVLSGLSAHRSEERNGDAAVRFGFDHEIYRDALLAEHLVAFFKRQDDAYNIGLVRTVLGRELLSTKTVSAIVSQLKSALAYRIISDLCGFGLAEDAVASSNVGELASTLIGSGVELAGLSLVGLRIQKLDLSFGNISRISLQGCVIDEMSVASGRSMILSVNESEIGTVRLNVAGVAGGNLPFVSEVDIASTTVGLLISMSTDGSPSGYWDSERDILTELKKAGWSGVEGRLAELEVGATSSFQIFVEEALRKLDVRQSRSFVVEDRTNIPGSTAPHGLHDPDNPFWSELVGLLVGNGLARRKRIEASGAAKSSITLLRPLSVIRDRAEAAVFWKEVHAHR